MTETSTTAGKGTKFLGHTVKMVHGTWNGVHPIITVRGVEKGGHITTRMKGADLIVAMAQRIGTIGHKTDF